MSISEGDRRQRLTRKERVAAVASGVLAIVSLATPILAAETGRQHEHHVDYDNRTSPIVLQPDTPVSTRHTHDTSLPSRPSNNFLDAINRADNQASTPTPRSNPQAY